jgi:hypothetical protein
MAELWSLAFALTSGAHSRTAREIVPRSGAILSAPRKAQQGLRMLVSASLVLKRLIRAYRKSQENLIARIKSSSAFSQSQGHSLQIAARRKLLDVG